MKGGICEKGEFLKRKIAVSVIHEATRTLSDEEQLLIKLVYSSDLSIPKASAVIGIAPSKARKKMKKILLYFQEKLLAKGIRK